MEKQTVTDQAGREEMKERGRERGKTRKQDRGVGRGRRRGERRGRGTEAGTGIGTGTETETDRWGHVHYTDVLFFTGSKKRFTSSLVSGYRVALMSVI